MRSWRSREATLIIDGFQWEACAHPFGVELGASQHTQPAVSIYQLLAAYGPDHALDWFFLAGTRMSTLLAASPAQLTHCAAVW